MSRRAWVALLALVAALSGCRMEIDLNVTVSEDGSGVVEVVFGLDREAVERVGGDLSAVLAVDDLVEAGWEIDGPAEDSDGFTRVSFSRPFGTPEEASEVFAQIAAEDGPFQDFQVTRESSFAETKWRFTGRVDFSGGAEAFGDDLLAAELDGEPLGQTVEEIEAQLGESLSRLIQVRVSARLPGDVTSNATTKADNGAVWAVGFGEGAVEMEAEGTERRTSTLVLAGAAIVLLFAALMILLFRLARRVTAKDPDSKPPAHAAK